MMAGGRHKFRCRHHHRHCLWRWPCLRTHAARGAWSERCSGQPIGFKLMGTGILDLSSDLLRGLILIWNLLRDHVSHVLGAAAAGLRGERAPGL